MKTHETLPIGTKVSHKRDILTGYIVDYKGFYYDGWLRISSHFYVIKWTELVKKDSDGLRTWDIGSIYKELEIFLPEPEFDDDLFRI